MLQNGSGSFDICGNIDAAICRQHVWKFFLHFATGSINVQNRNDDGGWGRYFLDKGNDAFQRISFYTHQNDIRVIGVMLHV